MSNSPRYRFPFRVLILSCFRDSYLSAASGSSRMPKIAFLFSGQGAQYVGMAQALCDSLSSARKLFDEAADILGYDLLDVCAKGPKDRLDSTAVSQPAIYVASLSALENLRAQQHGVESDCSATAGLSLGEYTAPPFAGTLGFADRLRLPQDARPPDEAPPPAPPPP